MEKLENHSLNFMRNKMILKDLIKEISFEEIKKRFPALYPAQKTSLPGYEKVYKAMLFAI